MRALLLQLVSAEPAAVGRGGGSRQILEPFGLQLFAAFFEYSGDHAARGHGRLSPDESDNPSMTTSPYRGASAPHLYPPAMANPMHSTDCISYKPPVAVGPD